MATVAVSAGKRVAALAAVPARPHSKPSAAPRLARCFKGQLKMTAIADTRRAVVSSLQLPNPKRKACLICCLH